MKVKYIGHDWNLFTGKVGVSQSLPPTPNVYLILVQLGYRKRNKIAYIGVTSNLRKRLSTHVVLSELRFSNNGYKIQILYRDFGSELNNKAAEVELIKKYQPPLEGSLGKKRGINLFSRYKFWKEIGVKRVRYGKGMWRDENYTVEYNFKKYSKMLANGSPLIKTRHLYLNRR